MSTSEVSALPCKDALQIQPCLSARSMPCAWTAAAAAPAGSPACFSTRHRAVHRSISSGSSAAAASSAASASPANEYVLE